MIEDSCGTGENYGGNLALQAVTNLHVSEHRDTVVIGNIMTNIYKNTGAPVCLYNILYRFTRMIGKV